MLGKQVSRRGLLDAECHVRHLAGVGSFHWQLSKARDQLFRDKKLATLYWLDNGCPSVLPSLLATALLLQAHDKVSDAEAHRRARVDLGWKVALVVAVAVKPCAQSTLQHFRAQLILHDLIQAVFLRSLELAKEKDLLKGQALTSPQATDRGSWPRPSCCASCCCRTLSAGRTGWRCGRA